MKSIIVVMALLILALCVETLPAHAQCTTPHANQTTSLLNTLGATGNRSATTDALYNFFQHIEACDLDALHTRLGTETNAKVRWGIVRALGPLGSSTSVTPLTTRLLNDSAINVRYGAALSLGQLGAAGVNGIAALESALENDTHAKVRMRAAISIVDIHGSNANAYISAAHSAEPAGAVRRLLQWQLLRTTQGDTFLTGLTRGNNDAYGATNGTFYRVYWPNSLSSLTNARILVAVHGTGGNPELYRNICEDEAENRQVLLVAPYFDEGTWFNFDNLNLMNEGAGYTRSDLRLLEILDAISTATGADDDRIFLFGHSRGGQFVQRFNWAHPSRVERSVAAGSGLYLGLDDTEDFPFGFGANPFAADLSIPTVLDYLAMPCAFVVGTEDVRNDLRITYAESIGGILHAEQENNGPEQLLVPGGVHLGSDNWPIAARFLFDDSQFPSHSADYRGGGGDFLIDFYEIMRVIQFFNSSGGLHCDKADGEDGFAPGTGAQWCTPHDLDYSTTNWAISLTELLRIIQIYNSNGGAYYRCGSASLDGDSMCLGTP